MQETVVSKIVDTCSFVARIKISASKLSSKTYLFLWVEILWYKFGIVA
jgi:hypothetical protein